MEKIEVKKGAAPMPNNHYSHLFAALDDAGIRNRSDLLLLRETAPSAMNRVPGVMDGSGAWVSKEDTPQTAAESGGTMDAPAEKNNVNLAKKGGAESNADTTIEPPTPSTERALKMMTPTDSTDPAPAAPKTTPVPLADGTPEPSAESAETSPMAPAQSVSDPHESDATGEVMSPADLTAYVAAITIRNKHDPAKIARTHKMLVQILQLHPEIKRHHPRVNRLMVHLADWLACASPKTKAASGNSWASRAEVEKNKAALQREKYGGQ